MLNLDENNSTMPVTYNEDGNFAATPATKQPMLVSTRARAAYKDRRRSSQTFFDFFFSATPSARSKFLKITLPKLKPVTIPWRWKKKILKAKKLTPFYKQRSINKRALFYWSIIRRWGILAPRKDHYVAQRAVSSNLGYLRRNRWVFYKIRKFRRRKHLSYFHVRTYHFTNIEPEIDPTPWFSSTFSPSYCTPFFLTPRKQDQKKIRTYLPYTRTTSSLINTEALPSDSNLPVYSSLDNSGVMQWWEIIMPHYQVKKGLKWVLTAREKQRMKLIRGAAPVVYSDWLGRKKQHRLTKKINRNTTLFSVGSKKGIITLSLSRSNYFITIANKAGEVLRSLSAGKLGYRISKKKRSLEAYEKLVFQASKELSELNMASLELIIKYKFYPLKFHINNNLMTQSLVKALQSERIVISKIRHIFLRPHGNPPRMPKLRRK